MGTFYMSACPIHSNRCDREGETLSITWNNTLHLALVRKEWNSKQTHKTACLGMFYMSVWRVENTYHYWGWVATAPILTLIIALPPLPALLVVMVVVVVHVVDVGEWCGGVVVVASSKGGW